MQHDSVNDLVDQWNGDSTGWARFSADMAMRYRLGRSLRGGRRLSVVDDSLCIEVSPDHHGAYPPVSRALFILLNPSDADAFDPDPTVGECRKRAVSWGADILEVVNLFAFRSPYPRDLRKRAHGFRGDDETNNRAILSACVGASWVVAGWGRDGALDHRDVVVRRLLGEHGVALHHLGLTKDGFPKHPLARGVHRIPAEQLLTPWMA